MKRSDTVWPSAGGVPHLRAPRARPPIEDSVRPKISNVLTKLQPPTRPKPVSLPAEDLGGISREFTARPEPPIIDIPAPSQLSRANTTDDIVMTGRSNDRGPPLFHLNPHKIPTHHTLNHSIVVTDKPVWDLYDALEYCVNQGDCPWGAPILSRRRGVNSEHNKTLYVIKRHRWTSNDVLRHFTKPSCPYLVALHSAFYADSTLWIVYEEMDISLDQIFELDRDPWTIAPEGRDRQIAAISHQAGGKFTHITSTAC